MHTNLGNLQQAQDRLEDAVRCHQRVLALDPENAEAWCNLGSVLDLQGRTVESEAAYDRALALKPRFKLALLNRSLLHLRKGEFTLGLPGYEHRLCLHLQRRFMQPQWKGEPLSGARILLHAEQGLGDTLQFIRYLPFVQKTGGKVVLEVQPHLRRLLSSMAGVQELISAGEPLPPFDWHCPLMSLPLAFGTDMKTIPNTVPYLTVPQEAAEKASCFQWPKTGLRIGLAWAGRPEHLRDRYRSIPLPLLAPLFRLEGAHFFSLQLGLAAAELADANTVKGAIDLTEAIEDMVDTAALIAHLDLVITVDTAVAHLAGALGKPVW